MLLWLLLLLLLLMLLMLLLMLLPSALWACCPRCCDVLLLRVDSSVYVCMRDECPRVGSRSSSDEAEIRSPDPVSPCDAPDETDCFGFVKRIPRRL